MPNKNYVAGRRFEYAMKKSYEEQGCVVMRTSGSHGPFDLIVIRPGGAVYGVQCKVVSSQAAADRLVRKFTDSPPLPKSTEINQLIATKVKGARGQA